MRIYLKTKLQRTVLFAAAGVVVLSSIYDGYLYGENLINSSSTAASITDNSKARSIDDKSTGRTIVIIGLSNEVKNKEWQDNRIGMGLRVVLSQLFFESGEFAMLEEKPEIRKKLNDFAHDIWALNKSGYNFKKDIENTKDLGADFIAYGKIFYFGKPKSKFSFGPMHLNRNSVVIKVEVTLEDLKTGKKIKEKGKGVSTTTASSALFQFREDNVELDKTNIGNATKDALSGAVVKVLKKFRKKYK